MKNVIKLSTAAVLFTVAGAVFAQDAKPAIDAAKAPMKVAQNTADSAATKMEKEAKHKEGKKAGHNKSKKHHSKKSSQEANK